MKATSVIRSHQRRVLRLVAELLEHPVARAESVAPVIDAVTMLVVFEQRVLELAGASAARHRAAHTWTRLALFRIATSPTDGAVFYRYAQELLDLFDGRTGDLVACLERTVAEEALLAAGAELATLSSEVSPESRERASA